MKGRMQKITMSIGSRPQNDSTECESYEGVQTFMDMTENNLKEVQFERGNLLEFILSPSNLNLACLQVKRNHGSCGVDGLSTEELGGCLKEHKDELVESLKSGRYRPSPVLRVEIPKDNGKKRPLGIPTVVDRVIQQAISQILREFGIILKQNQLSCMFNGISLQCFRLIVIKAICCQCRNKIH